MVADDLLNVEYYTQRRQARVLRMCTIIRNTGVRDPNRLAEVAMEEFPVEPSDAKNVVKMALARLRRMERLQ